MKLLYMELENFQGIKALKLNFGGVSGTIYGDNGTGKTTVFNALTWLLFDKASTGAKDFSPKTKGADGEDLHHLNHSVKASFQQETGQITSFWKVYHEVYKKKKGSAYEERDGHTVDYFVDGVPTKEREYTSTVLGCCGGDAEKPKMLTMPDYFAEQLKWQTRRKILLEVCGDVSDKEIINSSTDLKDLAKYLVIPGTSDGIYGIDEYRKIAAARLKDLNKQLEAIPGRIDEAEKAIPDVSGIDSTEVEEAIERTNEKIYQLQKERADAESGDSAKRDIQAKLDDLNHRIANGRLVYMTEQGKKREILNARIMEAERTLAVHRTKATDAKLDKSRKQRQLDDMISTRERIMKEWKKVNAESLTDDAKVCPTCGRELPEDKLENVISSFNRSKSRRLAQLNMKGKTEASKDMIEKLRCELQEIEKKESNEAAAIAEAERELDEAKKDVYTPVSYEQTDEYRELSKEGTCLGEQLLEARKNTNELCADIDEEISTQKQILRRYEEERVKLGIADEQRKRVTELEKNEAKLTEEYGKTERGLYLCDLFVRRKVDMLTDKINRKFRRVRFRLFEVQQNGGLKEGCDVMVPTEDGRLVPYSIANNAARINAGLEIIGTLSEHWGVKLPVVVDNAESVTRLAKIDTQMIRLVVSEQDKVLRLEV